MKVKHVDKHYLYLRDGGRCYFCHKPLVYGKVSLDHYQPRSQGGTDDVFNLVTSCKACNGLKRNQMPEDCKEKHLEWFIQGVLARKILCSSQLKVSPVELDLRVKQVKRSYSSGSCTVFESERDRFFVKDNTITQISAISQMLGEED